MRIDVKIIGIGSGSAAHLTRAAVTAMNVVDLFLVADKGAAKHDLAVLRRDLCAEVIDHDRYRFVEVADPPRDRQPADYEHAVHDWHAARTAAYADTIAAELPNGGTVGFLVWGDPAFYDSTIRIAEGLARPGLGVGIEVVPGISSLQLLAAAHRIVLNEVGRPIHITTGRRLLTEYTAELGDVIVMLDGDLECADLVPLHPDLIIFWGAQLGLPDEHLVSGRLGTVIEEIVTARARIRERRGWVMDTYLLRPN